MRLKKKSILALLLAMLMVFSACNSSNAPAQTEEPTQAPTNPETLPEVTTPVVVDTVYDLIENGKSAYRIVLPATASNACKSLVNSFRTEVKTETGVQWEVVSDQTSMAESGYETAKEILIGKTAYQESEAVLRECNYNGYCLRAVGEKIVLTASDDTALQQGLLALQALISEKKSGQSVSLKASELKLQGSDGSVISALPVYVGKQEGSIIDCADDCYMMLATNCEKQDFTDYCATLESRGYSLYTSHTTANNRYATYINDTHTVTLYYAPSRRAIRAMVEEKSALPPKEAAPYTAVTTPSVTMLGMEVGGYNNGLGLIFRLSDGSFVIFDSGIYEEKFADRLYAKLCELAPDPDNIVIRAWFFSHCHMDHVGAFLFFEKKYKTEVTVESFVYNFTTNAVYDTIDNGANRGQSKETREAVAAWEGSEEIKAHTGQRFYFADGMFEILYTAEDMYPAIFRDGNTESLVLRVELGGEVIMCLGDEYMDSSQVLVTMYGKYLKSDIVQASHHGRNGATPALNSQIGAETVLWPGGYHDFPEVSVRDYNVKLLEICKDLYIAGSDGVTLELPYTVQNNKEAAFPKQ